MIKLLKWAYNKGVEAENARLHVAIHEAADMLAAERYDMEAAFKMRHKNEEEISDFRMQQYQVKLYAIDIITKLTSPQEMMTMESPSPLDFTDTLTK